MADLHPSLQAAIDSGDNPVSQPGLTTTTTPGAGGLEGQLQRSAEGIEAEENRRQNRDLVDPTKGGAIYPPESEGGVVPYNEFWYDRGTSLAEGRRTSLIVDPPDGRIPSLMSDVAEQGRAVSMDVEGRRPVRFRSGGIGADGPEDRGLAERCIVGFNAGPP